MKKVKRVIILGDGNRPRIKKFSERIFKQVKSLVPSVRLELDSRKDLSRARADCMIIIGGDGTILSAAGRMGKNQIPSIGIQMGRFGFLSELTPDDCTESLEKIFLGKITVRKRMMLSCRVQNGKRTVFKGLALNDVVVASGSVSRMVMVDMAVEGGFVTTFHGDGVIIATPVGSTAHSLSAGGPIMEPSMRAFIITPICSHALTVRPLVIEVHRIIRLKPRGSRNALSLTLDGQRVHKLSASEEVFVETAPVSFQLIRVEDRNYFEILRKKFNWGGTLLDDSRTNAWSRKYADTF